jgi:hypothetical protein
VACGPNDTFFKRDDLNDHEVKTRSASSVFPSIDHAIFRSMTDNPRRFAFTFMRAGVVSRVRIGFLILVMGFIGSGCQNSEKTTDLVNVHCLPIEASTDSICLFRDRRLDSTSMDSLWLSGDDSGHVKAQLRRISASGKSMAVFTLEPLARLGKARISGKQFFLATEDLSVGAGSYNGPVTHVLDASSPNRIDEARDNLGHEITLLSSLKSVWKVVPDGILEATCAPDTALNEDSVAFIRYFERLRYQNGKWVRTERVESGYTDFGDEEFPAHDKFPR